ncbi:MAG: hypothetical protein ACTHU1_04940 [Arachnia sp.]
MITHPTPDVAQLMAGIIENRARMWELIEEVTAAPDDAMVNRLTNGEWVEEMQGAVQWLGEAADRFSPGLKAVETTTDETPVSLERMTAGHEAITARQRTSLPEIISDLQSQLAAEKRAWSSRDDEHAKTLRLAEHDLLHTRMVPAVQQWCYDALHQPSAPVLSALAKVVAVVLSMETGRDFERGMEGRGFRITDDLPRS